jgi:hypothetical protein
MHAMEVLLQLRVSEQPSIATNLRVAMLRAAPRRGR